MSALWVFQFFQKHLEPPGRLRRPYRRSIPTKAFSIPTQIAVFCIGSDRATGDCLGPLVGSMLTWKGFPGKIYGTLDQPVHACNLKTVMDDIKGFQGRILGVDACLGTKSEVGTILVKEGPLKPGLGVNKDLPPVGHFHVVGIVNVGGFMEHMVLQNTRLSVVVKMAQAIAWGNLACGKVLKLVRKEAQPTLRPSKFGRQIGRFKRNRRASILTSKPIDLSDVQLL